MNYYIQKAVGLLVTLLLVSFITFSVFQILPGNPAYIILGVDADPMQIEALNKSMGLDKPALVRYVDWIAGLFRGDLGVSYRYQQPVAQLISDALEVTGSLAIITLILTLIIGVLAGCGWQTTQISGIVFRFPCSHRSAFPSRLSVWQSF